MMKHIAIVPITLGLSAATALAGPAETVAPSSEWVGDITLGYNYTNLSGEDNASNEAGAFGAFDLEFQLGRQFDNYFVQFDLFGEFTDIDSNENDSYDDGLGIAAHVMRDTSFGGIGGFIGALETHQDEDNTDSSERYFAGLEAKWDPSDCSSYYFQVGYFFGAGGNDSNGRDSLREATFLRVVGTKELTECLSLIGEVGYVTGEMDSDDDGVDIVNLGIALNKQISDSLVASLSYDYAYYHQEEQTGKLTEHVLGLSLTYSFGASERGTDLSVPRVLRMSGMTGGQLE